MTTNTDTTAGQHDANAPGAFARIELPPVPTFGRPPLAYDPMEALRDEPPMTWQSPFPQPEQPRPYTYRVAPPPMAAMPMQAELAMQRQAVVPVVLQPAPVATAAPVAAPAPSRIPPMVVTPEPQESPATDAGDVAGGPARVAIALLVVLAAVLFWASGMAFSAALSSMMCLVLVELVRAHAAARPEGTSMLTKVVTAVVIILAALSVLSAIAAVTEGEFVAGLFVLVALAPTLLLVGGAALVLRLKKSSTTGDVALRAGVRRLLIATALIAVAGYHANKTFAPTIDSIVAIAIGGFVLLSAVRVLRGNRAA